MNTVTKLAVAFFCISASTIIASQSSVKWNAGDWEKASLDNDKKKLSELIEANNKSAIDNLINRTHNGWTLLNSSCAEGDFDFANCLVLLGADVNTKTPYGQTALMLTCSALTGKRHEQDTIIATVKNLLANGAHETIDSIDINGHFALDFACKCNNWELFDVLFDHGARMHTKEEIKKAKTALLSTNEFLCSLINY